MKQATDFARFISNYLNDYLVNEKGASANTVKSYSYTFILFIKYMRDKRNVTATKLTFQHINKEVIVSFLDWLQKERGCCDATRNQRLAAISSFISVIMLLTPLNAAV